MNGDQWDWTNATDANDYNKAAQFVSKELLDPKNGNIYLNVWTF
jgi:hypothetical protein